MLRHSALRFGKRLFSTSTEVTLKDIITEKTKTQAGDKIRKINIVEKFKTMSTTKKKILLAYGIASTGCYIAQTYNDGKSALEDHRQKKNNLSYYNQDTDWQIIKKGCSHNSWGNFWYSVFFPWNLTAEAVPYIVLMMNKQDDSKTKNKMMNKQDDNKTKNNKTTK